MIVKEMTFTLEEISQIAGQYLKDKHGLYIYQTIEPFFINGKLNFKFAVNDGMKLEENI